MAGVKLFVPSEFGGATEGATEGVKASKARVQDQLKAVGISYTLFYTGAYADFIWVPYASEFASVKYLETGHANPRAAVYVRNDATAPPVSAGIPAGSGGGSGKI